ncbi:MAG: acyl-CoA dehydrogenase family protein [Dehalococcoidia bacterium]
MVQTAPDILTEVAALRPLIESHADAAERARRQPPEVIEALTNAGIFRLLVPRALGGLESDPVTMVRVFEELSIADGSAGWIAMIGGTTGVVGGALPEAAGRRVFGDPSVIASGVIAPKGKARPTDGGYIVSGRWPFASGCEHSDWLTGGCFVFDKGEDAFPSLYLMFFPASDAEVIDTWHVSGLRGTGSHDIAVKEVFVPSELAVNFGSPTRTQPGALYAFPIVGLLAIAVASVALGIARRSLNELIALAPGKTPAFGFAAIAERPAVQEGIARGEAALRAARALFLQTIEETWEQVQDGQEVSLRDRALLRLAASQAVAGSVQAVDAAYNLAGSSSIYETSVLQRCFRDIHVLTQHATVAPPTFEVVGRVLLGLDAGTPLV